MKCIMAVAWAVVTLALVVTLARPSRLGAVLAVLCVAAVAVADHYWRKR